MLHLADESLFKAIVLIEAYWEVITVTFTHAQVLCPSDGKDINPTSSGMPTWYHTKSRSHMLLRIPQTTSTFFFKKRHAVLGVLFLQSEARKAARSSTCNAISTGLCWSVCSLHCWWQSLFWESLEMVWLFGSSASTWSRGRAARCYSSTWQWLTFCSTWLCLSVPTTTSLSSTGSLEAPSATSASSCWQWTAVEVPSSWWLSLWTGTCVWCIPIIPSTLWVYPKPCVEHLGYGCSASQCQLTSSLWNTTQPTARASWSRLNPNLIWAGISLRFSSPSLSLWLWFSTAPSTLLSTWEGDSWASKQRLRRLCASSQSWRRSSSFASSRATSCSCWFGSRPSNWPTATPHLKSALPWKTRPTYFTSPSAWPISTARWILWSTTSPALPSRTSAGELLIWQ